MKSFKCFLLILFATLSFTAHAQYSIGLKGGYTMAWQYYNMDLPDNAEIRVRGLNISVPTYFQVNKYLEIGVEAGFVTRGAACVPGWQPVFAGDTRYYLNYLEAPLMFAGKLPFYKGILELFVKTGYGPSCLVIAHSQQSWRGDFESQPREKMPIGNDGLLNRWDHGVYSGLGIGVKLGPGKLFYETDFYLGLRNAEKNFTSKNRSLNFSLGYIIDV